MDKNHKSTEKIASNKTKRFELRLSEAEYKLFLSIEQRLGISRTELVRKRVLEDSTNILINGFELIKALDNCGAELGKISSCINDLARYANRMVSNDTLNKDIISDFNLLMGNHIAVEKNLESAIRQIIRLIKT